MDNGREVLCRDGLYSGRRAEKARTRGLAGGRCVAQGPGRSNPDEPGGLSSVGRGDGVRPASASSIVIDFRYNGERCREPIKLPPTKANLQYARNYRGQILREIALGT